MKAYETFTSIKPHEAPPRSVKTKIKLIFSLGPGLVRNWLKSKENLKVSRYKQYQELLQNQFSPLMPGGNTNVTHA